MSSWECPACGALSDGIWGACVGCRALRLPEGGWPGTARLVLLYPGDTQIDAAARYDAHAGTLDTLGYRAMATSWGEERPRAGDAFLMGNLEEAYRVGTLLVTYHRSANG